MDQIALPKIDDGCVIHSWRCANPSRDEMTQSDEKLALEQKQRCKRCPVCKMVFCKEHMENVDHLRDCNFRSNQDREVIEAQRNEAHEKELKRQQLEADIEKARIEFEEKEAKRKEKIAKRNRQAQNRG